MADNNDERAYEVEFLSCVADKSQDFKIVDADSHFTAFTGVHISKIHQGKLYLQDVINPPDRQAVLEKLRKKDAPYIYIDFDILGKDENVNFVHCCAQNDEATPLCRLVLADVSKSREKAARLKQRASEINNLIDQVEGGVCVFRVTPEMHFEALYMNASCCRLFGTGKDRYSERNYRLDELIFAEDKTLVYQAIGRAMATGEAIDLEYRVKTHKSKLSWCQCNAAVHHLDENGSPVFHAVFTDVSRVKQAEERADRASEKLANLIENLSGAVIVSCLEEPLRCELVSGEFLSLLGYTRAQFFERFGADLGRLIVGGGEKIEQEIQSAVRKSGRCELEYELKCKGAKILRVRDRRRLITQKDGTMELIAELEIIN